MVRYFISYDPAAALRKVTCPVLAINGEKDMQVPPKQNLAAIRAALAAGGNKHFEVDELVGLNHLFRRQRAGRRPSTPRSKKRCLQLQWKSGNLDTRPIIDQKRYPKKKAVALGSALP